MMAVCWPDASTKMQTSSPYSAHLQDAVHEARELHSLVGPTHQSNLFNSPTWTPVCAAALTQEEVGNII
jgi:hypothetical protein